MATHKPFTEISTLQGNANGDVTILEAHLDSAHNTIADVLEYLAQAIWSAGGVVLPGSVSNPSDAIVRVQNRLGVTADARTLLAVADQSVDLAGVATGTRCLVVIQAKAGASTSHNFVDATTGESLTHYLLSAWGKVEVIEGDNSNYPPLPSDCVPVADVTKTGPSSLTIDSVITTAPTPRAGGGGGATDFTDLDDAPSSYAGHGGKVVAVTVGEDGLEFVTPGGGGSSAVDIDAQTGTTYTLVLADAGKLVTLTNANPITLTVPTHASVAYPTGTVIALAQLGAGLVTVEGATGVTINGTTPGDEALAGQWATATLTKLAANTWLLSGGLA